MGLFGLGKKKKEAPKFDFPSGDLEVPPPPPSTSGEQLPEFPSFPEEKEAPKDISIPPPPPVVEAPAEEKPPVEAKMEPPKEDFHPFKEEKVEVPAHESKPEIYAGEEHEERIVPDRPVFVSVDIFRHVVDELNNIRNRLNTTLENAERVVEYRSEEETHFSKWHTHLEDLQQKLMLIDRSLFERG